MAWLVDHWSGYCHAVDLDPAARDLCRVRRSLWHDARGTIINRLNTEIDVLNGSLYADLNWIHAGIAETPKESRFTSAFDRIQARCQDVQWKKSHSSVDTVCQVSWHAVSQRRRFFLRGVFLARGQTRMALPVSTGGFAGVRLGIRDCIRGERLVRYLQLSCSTLRIDHLAGVRLGTSVAASQRSDSAIRGSVTRGERLDVAFRGASQGSDSGFGIVYGVRGWYVTFSFPVQHFGSITRYHVCLGFSTPVPSITSSPGAMDVGKSFTTTATMNVSLAGWPKKLIAADGS